MKQKSFGKNGPRPSRASLQESPGFEAAFHHKPISPAEKFRPDFIKGLMRREGYQRLCAPEAVLAAAALSESEPKRALRAAERFFLEKAFMVPAGLDGLPERWLAEIPGILWHLRKPHWEWVPYFIRRLEMRDGVLLVQFCQELPEPGRRMTGWDKIRVGLNAGLYPSLWSRLKPCDAARLEGFEALHRDSNPSRPLPTPALF